MNNEKPSVFWLVIASILVLGAIYCAVTGFPEKIPANGRTYRGEVKCLM